MGYKQGILWGSSIAMLIFSSILLILFISCSSVCQHEDRSYYAPVWTSLLGLAIACFGIGMSKKKEEKTYGGLFFAFCIVCIFASMGCMVLVNISAIYELFGNQIGDQVQTSVIYNFGITPTPTTSSYPSAVQPPSSSGTAFALWQCMMGTAGILTVIYIVASCMFCCCQESSQRPVVQGTHVVHVLTNGFAPQPTGHQQVVFNNQAFVIQQVPNNIQQPAIVVVAGAQPAGGNPPPYHAVVNQGQNNMVPGAQIGAAGGAEGGPGGGPSLDGSSGGPSVGGPSVGGPVSGFIGYSTVVNNPAATEQQAPTYMPLITSSTSADSKNQQQLNTTDIDSGTYEPPPELRPVSEDTGNQQSAESAETYSYVDNLDSLEHQQQRRERISTPDEVDYYDDVINATDAPLIPPDDGGNNAEYSYATTDSLKTANVESVENSVYANDSRVQQPRPRPGRSSPTPTPQAEYLEVLP